MPFYGLLKFSGCLCSPAGVCVCVCVYADAAVKTPVLLLVTRNMCQSRKIFAANFPRLPMGYRQLSVFPFCRV